MPWTHHGSKLSGNITSNSHTGQFIPAREAGGPQHSDTLDSLLHGSEPEWAHPLHGGYPRQPDCFLVSASYCGDVSEGFLHLEWASSCLQEVAVDAVEVTPAENFIADASTVISNGQTERGGDMHVANCYMR